MLTNFLFINIFLHIIFFHWMKVEFHTYIFRLTVISLLIALFSLIQDTMIFYGDFAITILNDTLRINQAILAQESLYLGIALILLFAYRDLIFKPEFFLIYITNIISATYLLESYNFIVFFISWELFNLSLYILIIGNGVKRQESLAASLKYFLLSAFSTAFLLLGFAILYHLTGSLEFEAIYIAMSFIDIKLPIVLIIFALLFKIGAAPLHFWAPDLYDATKLPITAYISNLPKLLYLFLALNLIDFLQCQFNFFIIAGFLSLIFGSLGLIQQFKIKRFLAFSAIANVGYFLIIIQYSGLVLYNIILYILPVINIFIILITIHKYYEKDLDSFEVLKGLFKTNPFLALSLVISLFSIAGIPPLPGFFAKYLLISKAFTIFHPLLFIIIIFTTVVAVANYIKIIYFILFYKPSHNLPIKKLDEDLVIYFIIGFNFIVMTLLTYMDLISIIFANLGYAL